MIPVKLTIEGLYSYQKRQTIDFSRLVAANLFGIFGSVGSGKSSILEAITFAIYGKTDRLNLSGDNRNYNMMNLKSKELLIEFIFETGKNQTAYRTVVKARRNSKKFEEVKTFERLAYRYEGQQWIPVETTEPEQAIGLSYINFKRTVIIPQGQFQEFLQLGDKDRTQMMKELFNLDRFELFYKVTSLESKNNARKQTLEGQLRQLGEIDPGEVKRYEEQLETLKKDLADLAVRLDSCQKQEIQWRQLQELSKKLEEAQKKLKQLAEEEPNYIELEKSIIRYEHCLVQFKGLLDSLDSSDNKITRQIRQIEEITGSLEKAEGAIAASEITFVAVKTAYDRREELKQRDVELSQLLKIMELKKEIGRESGRLQKGEDLLRQTVEEAANLKIAWEKLDDRIKAERLKLPDLTVLSKVKTWHVEKQNMLNRITELKSESGKFRNEIGRISQAIRQIFQEPVFEGLPAKADIQVAISHLRTILEQTKNKLKKLDNERDNYQVKARLKAHAGQLQDGEPCPLCGSVHHPAVFNDGSLQESLHRIEKAREEAETAIDSIKDTINRLNETENQLKFNSRHLDDLTEREEELEKKLALHQECFQWEAYTDGKVVAKAFEDAERIQNELKNNEPELAKITQKREKAQANKELYQTELEKIKRGLAERQAALTTLTGQLDNIVPDQYLMKSSSEIESERKQLIEQYTRLEKRHQELSEQLTGLRKLKDTLCGSLEANQKEIALQKETHRGLQQQLLDRLKHAGYSQAEEVRQILAQPVNLEANKQLLAMFRQNIHLSRSLVQQLREDLGDREYNREIHQQLQEEIRLISEQLDQKNREVGKISELLKKLKNDLENQAMLQKEMESIDIRSENIRTLKYLFKGSGFVNYISSVHLQNLCQAANERFYHLTRQKLSLEITADNNFQVRDFLNGGKVRSVKTLSGGQTFQAALSLALALADNIQQITMSNQNFFFLDEGFGSLDKESLAVAFDTLKSLRKENRIVGIISHVEEMQQEIDIHLRVDNDPETGSIIHPSWE